MMMRSFHGWMRSFHKQPPARLRILAYRRSIQSHQNHDRPQRWLLDPTGFRGITARIATATATSRTSASCPWTTTGNAGDHPSGRGGLSSNYQQQHQQQHHQGYGQPLQLVSSSCVWNPPSAVYASPSCCVSKRSYSSNPTTTTTTTNDNNTTAFSDTPVVHAAASIIAPDVLAMATDPNPHRYWDTVGKSNPRRRLKLIYATYIDYIAHFETGQNSAVLVWKDQLTHITDTAELLHLEAWTMDEQAKAEQLLLFWSTRETIRSVILQFALFQKIIELHVNAPKLRRETTLMCQMIANWRMVYTAEGIQGPTTLRQVGLSPPGLFSIILDTFHGHYGCFVREMMLHIILEASVATDGQPDFASQVLQTSIDLFKSHRYCFPDIRLFNLVIMAWHGKGQTTVEQFLKITALMKEYEVEPDKASYQLALQMFGDLQTPEGARQAEKMLNQMIKNYVENSAYAQPDLFCFSMVADAWVKSGDPEANAKVVDLFRQMEVMRDEGMVFGGESYVGAVIHSVLESYGSVPNKEWAAAEAEKFLRTCGHDATAILYVSLVKLYCRCGDETSVHRLLNEMQGKQIELEPIDYTTLFTSLANSNLDKKVQVATAILNSIKHSPHLMPSTILYNAYLTVLLSSAKMMPVMAMQVLEEMRNNQPESRPDKKTYTTVINAYSRAGDVKTAGNVLRMMYEEYYKTRDENLAPDLIAFNAVLNGYARTRDGESIKEAEDFLQDLLTMSKDGATNLKPDTYTIVAVLNCYANCSKHFGGGKRKQAIKALQLLRDCRKWDVQPNNTCYNATLNTMCKAEMIDDILALYEEMMRDYESGNKSAKPDVITLNILLKSYAFSNKRDATDRAERLMEEFAARGIMPNMRSYSSLILCYSVTQPPGGAARAEAILQHMDRLYAAGQLEEPPSSTTFKTLRKLWHYSNEPNREEGLARVDREMRLRFGGGGGNNDRGHDHNRYRNRNE